MKKIIIVGHNQENNEKLETLFQHFGMKKALPSRREELTPIQVGELLSKAIKSQAPQIQEIDEEELPKKLPTHISKRRLKKNLKKQQNTQAATALPKSMWDYIPMDLMIANIDNEFWGWADKNALEHLEYWKNLDPSIYFVLTYDQPQSLLHKLESENEDISKEVILEKLDDWNTYNKKMLDFFEKNQERSILISNERVKQQNNSSIKTLYSQVVPDFLYKDTEINLIYNNETENQESLTSNIIIENIINKLPNIYSTYNKLQNVSNLPYNEDRLKNIDFDLSYLAWRDFLNKKNTIRTQELEINEIHKILDKQEHSIKLKDKIINDKDLENQNLKTEAFQKQKENSSIIKEKEIVLEQLYFIQGELENSFTNNQELVKREKDLLLLKNKLEKELEKEIIKSNSLNKTMDDISKENNLLNKKHNKLVIQLDELNLIIKQLNTDNQEILKRYSILQEDKNKYDVKNSELKSNVNMLNLEKDMLIKQLHSLQEELESIYLKKDKEIKLWGASDRIRNHIYYRLGSSLIANSKSPIGWIKMPFSLLNTYIKYKREFKLNNLDKLPKIEEYQDISEAERIKKHLSYRLGFVFSENIKNPLKWLFLPLKLYQEIQDFRRNRK